MNKYELALILNSMLDDDALKAEFDKVTELITRFGGEVEKVDNWGKRRFAYEIEKMTEGFYYFIVFGAANNVPAELESRLRIMENVVRFLIIRMEEPRALKPKEKAKAEAAAAAKAEVKPEPQPEPTTEPESEPTTEAQPEPVAEAQPEPAAEPQPEPAAEANTEPDEDTNTDDNA